MANRPDSSDVHGARYGAGAGRRNQTHTAAWVRGRGHDRIRPVPQAEDDDTAHAVDAVSIDEVVERLSREMDEAVHRAADGERDELREYEHQVLREQQTGPSRRPVSPANRARNVFLMLGTFLAIAGIALMLVMPPAGIVCLVMAGIAAVMGAVLRPGDDTPERHGDGEPRAS
jgi:Flp pilus assembly protein TadB